MAPTSLKAAVIGMALALAGASGAIAETRALLVGVGRYPGLARDYQMAAPAQDVRRLASSLAAAGLDPSRMTVLTEGEGGQGPDRTRVLAAFAELEDAAGPGDQILIYFSGHGGQRPASRPSLEADGLEEVWLTSDARLDAQDVLVSGYLADHEIAAAVQRMRRSGADVWLVVDACYAGGVTRSAGHRVKAGPPSRRSPDRRGEDADPILGPEQAVEPGVGRFTAFYAAGADSLALAGPEGSPFTSALARALDGGRTSSLADLAAGVLAVDARLGVDAPRPVFEGDLNGPVLDLGPTRPRRFALRQLRDGWVVAAGVEEGVTIGDWLETEDAEGRRLGPVRIAAVDVGESRLEADAPRGAVAGRIRRELERSTTPAGRLLAALQLLGGRWSSDLEVTARLARFDPADCESPVDPVHPAPAALTVRLTAVPTLQNCDVIYVRVENRGATPLDVSILYLAADGGVVGPGLHPVDDGRMRPGDRRDVAFRIVAETDDVTERLAVIATPARSRFPLDLRYLATPGQAADRPARSASDWWSQVLDPRVRRGALAPAPGETAVAVAFPIRVVSMTGNVRR